MADKQLSISITAKNAASAVLAQVAKETTTVGTAAEASSKKASTAFDELNKHAALLGSLIGTTLVGSLREFAAAGEENARATRQLQTAIADAGQSYEDFAGQIEKATSSAAKFGISDDLATNALQALVEHTKDATKAMDLLQVTEDLAAAKHLNLVDAANLIGKVYDGNTAILTRYGVSVASGATAEEALAQVQAQFAGQAEANSTALSRFTAEVENWKGQMGAALGPLSGFITLLPGLSVGMQAALAGGGLLVDMFRATRAASAEATAALEVQAVATASVGEAGVGAAVAEGGLLAALTGPVGLAIAAGAAAAAIGYLILRHHDESDALKKVTLDVDGLREAYAALNHATIGQSNLGTLFGITQSVGTLSDQRDKAIQDVKDAQAKLGGQVVGYSPAVQGSAQDAAFQSAAEESHRMQQAYIDQMKEQIGTSEAFTKAGTQVQQIYAHLGDSGVDATRVTGLLNDAFVRYNQTLADGHPNFVQLETDINNIKAGMYQNTQAATDAIDAWTKLTGEMTTAWSSVMDPMANADAQIKHIGSSMDATAVSAQKLVNDALNQFHTVAEHGTPEQIAAAYKVLGETIDGVDKKLADSEALHAFTASLGDLVHPVQDASDQITKAVTDVMNATGKVAEQQKTVVSGALAELNAELAMDGNDVDAASASWAKFWNTVSGADAAVSADAAAKKLNDARAAYLATQNPTGFMQGGGLDAFNAAAQKARDDAMAAAQGHVDAAGLTPDFTDMLGSLGDKAAAAASQINHVTATMTDMQRVVIGNTDAIAQQSDSLLKWADGLIGAQGQYSKLDDLVNKGKISGQSGVFTGNNEYANAQKAYNDIAKDNLRVQEATAVIQAKQAPLLADLANKQADYLEKVEGMKPAEQLAALGFMDTTESMKAQNLVALAGQAAMGQLGEEGAKSAAKIIQGAAEADPALAAMLQSMGLISYGAHGEIIVDMPQGQSVQDAIDGLQTSINNLVELIYLISIDGDTTGFWNSIAGIDGQVVGTSYINVAYNVGYTPSGLQVGLQSGNMLGGVIQRHASGGSVLSWLAEAGPEALDFPGGGHGMAMNKAVYAVPEGTYVHTAPATKAMGPGGAVRNFNHYGNVYHYPSSGASARDQAQAAILGERR